MAAYKAELKVDGYTPKEKDPNNVQECFYDLYRHSENNNPTSDLRGGYISLIIKSSGADTFFADWMNSFEKEGKNGTVEFKGPENKTIRTVKFSKGNLVKYKEYFSRDGYNIESFTIITPKLEVGSVKFDINKS
ncbi:type VI secretion system tube protein TssD [Xanthovirga aplysinae]|uniref:type VI secretion system tube protein TssD n=1 Tax=Xanthovirga aplysinae TaxID=2529853 RepID=UPI0012BC4E6D|nr:type VI secretion system tube protein TssD [Xanthovirga aplysinae]MTI29759.1 phage tail protein [Xanthovirga aplysinae]